VEAFPETLRANLPRDSITLVYRLRDVDGIISWLGLRSAKRSGDTWRLLLADGSDIVHIGVLFDREFRGGLPLYGPITGERGRRIDALFKSTASQIMWVGENKCQAPPTYEVRVVDWNEGVEVRSHYAPKECIDYIFAHLSLPGHSTREELEKELQLKIWHKIFGNHGEYMIVDPARYRERVQKYAYFLNPNWLVVSFEIDNV